MHALVTMPLLPQRMRLKCLRKMILNTVLNRVVARVVYLRLWVLVMLKLIQQPILRRIWVQHLTSVLAR